jgi:hypothetical protein
MNTTKLNNGKTVLSHQNGTAKKYSNFTAAQNATYKLDCFAKVWQSPSSRVFFVEVPAAC